MKKIDKQVTKSKSYMYSFFIYIFIYFIHLEISLYVTFNKLIHANIDFLNITLVHLLASESIY